MLNIQFSPFRELKTPRLVLREIIPGDAQALFLMRSKPEVMKYADRDPASSLEQTEKFIELVAENFVNNEGIMWAITLDDTLIGTIGFWQIDKGNHRAEIGYMLLPEHWNKGFITEVLPVVIDYGFNRMKLHSIEANLNPGNIASIKALEKQGFVKEAYFKENHFYNGKFLDSLIYSKLAPKG